MIKDRAYICAKTAAMVSMDENAYVDLARLCREAIGESEYFNGTVEHDTEEMHLVLRVTLIVYREKTHDPCDATGLRTRITDIVPVWWECQTVQECGPVDNDFSWREFRECLL